jgi:hypothetical protein
MDVRGCHREGRIVAHDLEAGYARRPPKPGGRKARETVFVSDLTGNEIDERNGAKVTIAHNDARRGTVVLDVNADEGRRPGPQGHQAGAPGPQAQGRHRGRLVLADTQHRRSRGLGDPRPFLLA